MSYPPPLGPRFLRQQVVAQKPEPTFEDLLRQVDDLLAREPPEPPAPEKIDPVLLRDVDALLAQSEFEPDAEEWGLIQPKVNLGGDVLPKGVDPLEAQTINDARRKMGTPPVYGEEIPSPRQFQDPSKLANLDELGELLVQPLVPKVVGAKAFTGAVAGTTLSAPGRLMEWGAQQDPALGLMRGPGQALSYAGNTIREAMAPDPRSAAATSIMADPRVMLDPSFWANLSGSAGGSMLAFMAPQVAAGSFLGRVGQVAEWSSRLKTAVSAVGGSTAGAVVESYVEAGLAYDDAKNAGQSDEMAAQIAKEVAERNLAAIGISALAGYAAPKILNVPMTAKVVAGIGMESGQEVVQQAIGNVAAQRYDPERGTWEGAIEAGLGGGMSGGVMGYAGEAAEQGVSGKTDFGIKPEVKESLTNYISGWGKAVRGEPRMEEVGPPKPWQERGSFDEYAGRDADIQNALQLEEEAEIAARPPAPVTPRPPVEWESVGGTFFRPRGPGGPVSPAPVEAADPTGDEVAPAPPPDAPVAPSPGTPPAPPKPTGGGKRTLEDFSDEELLAELMANRPAEPVAPTPPVVEEPVIDQTEAGEQPRLPGDVGQVRDQEVVTPKETVPETEFGLKPPGKLPVKGKQGTIDEGVETERKRDEIEKSKAPVTPKWSPPRLEVDPEMLKYSTGPIERAYSGDTIGEKNSRLRNVFTHKGQLWTTVSSGGGMGPMVIRVVPRDQYTGTIVKMYEDIAGKGEGYDGVAVKYRGKDYVLVGPEHEAVSAGMAGMKPTAPVTPKTPRVVPVKAGGARPTIQWNEQGKYYEAKIIIGGRVVAQLDTDTRDDAERWVMKTLPEREAAEAARPINAVKTSDHGTLKSYFEALGWKARPAKGDAKTITLFAYSKRGTGKFYIKPTAEGFLIKPHNTTHGKMPVARDVRKAVENWNAKLTRGAEQSVKNEERRQDKQAPVLKGALPVKTKEAELKKRVEYEHTHEQEKQEQAKKEQAGIKRYRDEALKVLGQVEYLKMVDVWDAAKQPKTYSYEADFWNGVIAKATGDHPNQVYERVHGHDVFGKKPKAPVTEKDEAPSNVTWFRSGVARAPTDFDALADAGVPVGITMHKLSAEVRKRAIQFVKNGGKLFIDSGAYNKGAVIDWEELLTAYQSLAGATGRPENIWVVAPDSRGGQAETIQLQDEYASQIKSLFEQGLNVIIPVQRGELPLARQIEDTIELFGPDAIIGIPSNKNRYEAEEIGAALKSVLLAGNGLPTHIHLLGAGENRAHTRSVASAIHGVDPNIDITTDSNAITPLTGSGRPVQEGIRAEREEQGDNVQGDTPAVDDTELTAEFYRGNLDAFTKGELEQLATALLANVTDLRDMAKSTRADYNLRDYIQNVGLEQQLDAVIGVIARARAERQVGPGVRKEAITEATKPKAPVTPKKSVEQEQIDKEKEANAAERKALLDKLRKSTSSKLTSGVDPEDLMTMVKLVRTYIKDGVLQFREMVLKFQADWGENAERFGPDLARVWDMLQDRVDGLDVPGDAAAIMAGEDEGAKQGTAAGPGDGGGTGGTGGTGPGDDTRKLGGTGTAGGDRLVLARASKTKTVPEDDVPEDLAKKLYPHQVQGVAKALAAMTRATGDVRESNGFLLTDGTGAGKTSQELVVAETFRRAHKVVIIVTKPEVIKPDWKNKKIGGSFKADAKRLGITLKLAAGGETMLPGNIYITTYNRLDRFTVIPGAILILDESHSLKNVGAARSIAGMQHVDAADAVFFASATPVDKPQHMEYLARTGILEGKTAAEQYKALGMIRSTVRTKAGEKGIWVVSPRVGALQVFKNMAALFDRMTSNGTMLKREISMADVQFEIKHMTLSAKDRAVLEKIEDQYSGGVGVGGLNGLKRAALQQHLRRQQEPFKIPRTVEMVQEEMKAGRQVVIFLARVNYSEVNVKVKNPLTGEMDSHLIHASEGTAKALKNLLLLKTDLTEQTITEMHGAAEESAIDAMARFQSGQAKVLIATIESGGTGINLDDIKGDAPRTMIILTAPFSAVDNVQAVGRVWRLTTQSVPKIRYLFTDDKIDTWNARIIASKMKALGATVKGEVGRLNIDPAILEFDPTVDDVEALDADEKRRPPPRAPPPPPPPTREEHVATQQAKIDVALRELIEAQVRGAKKAAELRRERIRVALNEPVRLKPTEFNEAFKRALGQWVARATTAQLEARLAEIDPELQQERPWEPIEQVLIEQELVRHAARVLVEQNKDEQAERDKETQKEWDYLLRPVTNDLGTIERLELERIAAELYELQPQRRGPRTETGRIGESFSTTDTEWYSAYGGAKVYHDILDAPDAVNMRKGDAGIGDPGRLKMWRDIKDFLKGGKPTRVAGRAVIVARARADGGYPSSLAYPLTAGSLHYPELPPWWDDEGNVAAPVDEEEEVVTEEPTAPVDELPEPDWVTEGEEEDTDEPGAQGMAFPVKPKPRAPVNVRRQRQAEDLPAPPVTPLTVTPKGQWSVSQIREHLSKLLNVPIREGGFRTVQAFGRKRVLGLFFPHSEMIRMEHLNELPVFGHEVGHALDKKLKFDVTNSRWKAELLRIGRGTSMGSYKEAQVLAEGVAEFFRIYLQSSAEAARQAPNFFTEFESKLAHDAELWKGITLAKEQTHGLVKLEYAERGKQRISFADEASDQSWSEWNTERLKWMEQALIDDLGIVRRAEKGVIGDIPVHESGYALMRLARGAAAKAHAFLYHGVRDRSGKLLGPSLKSVLKPIKDLKTFSAFLVAKRVIELQTRPTNKILNTAMTLREALDIVRKHGSQTFEDAATKLYEFNDAMLVYAVESGAISAAQAKAMHNANQFYVPFARIQDGYAAQGFGQGVREWANRVSPFRRIRGSTRDIINPLETIIKNTYATVDMVEKNHAMLKFVDGMIKAEGSGQFISKPSRPMKAVLVNLDQLKNDIRRQLKRNGIDIPDQDWDDSDWNQMVTAWMPSTFLKQDQGYLSVTRNGKQEVYQVNDKGLFEVLTAQGAIAAPAAGLMRLLRPTARLLRAGATLVPGFLVKNLLRDQITAWSRSQAGYIPYWDFGASLAKMIGRPELWHQFLAGGAGQAAVVGMDRQYLDRSVRDLAGAKREAFLGRMFDTVRTPLDLVQALSEGIENMTRFGEWRRVFAKMKAKGASDVEAYAAANLAARNVTIDFGRGGKETKSINEMTAFFNARVQGYVTTAEALMGKDVSDAERAKRLTAVWLKAGLTLTLFSLANWWRNKDDDDYKKLEEWEKATWWHIKAPWTNSGWIRIPKPFELGTAFATIPEIAADYFYKHDAKAMDKAFAAIFPTPPKSDDMMRYTFELAVTMLGPSGMLTAMEIMTNYDTFRDRTIVSPWDDALGLEPELLYNRWTSETAKQLGRVLHFSPAFIDHAVNGFFAGSGTEVMKTGDVLLRTLNLAPRDAAEQPLWRQVPVIGGVIASVYRSSEVRLSDPRIQAVHDLAEYDSGKKKSAALFREQHRPERAKEVEAQRPAVWQAKAAHQAVEQFSDIRKQLRGVYEDQHMSPEQKRERINTLVGSMIKIAERVKTDQVTTPSKWRRAQ